MTNATMRKWALKYAAEGIRVFPLWGLEPDGTCQCKTNCGRDAGKHPLFTRWQKKATTNPKQIKEWFPDKGPTRNLAIATGAESGITVLDIDVAEGKQGMATWSDLIRGKGEPQTLMAKTGSGGFHTFFLYYAGLKTDDGIYGPDSDIDCRNDVGYVVAAPSLHRSGERYEWLTPWGTPIVALPAHLVPDNTRTHKPNAERQTYTLDEVEEMLSYVSAEDRGLWINVGVILGRTFDRSEEAWRVYQEWASKWTGTKARGHDQTMHTAFHETSQKQSVGRELSLRTIVQLAGQGGWVSSEVLELNTHYAVVWMGGDSLILREHVSPETGLLDVSFCTPTAVQTFHASNPKMNVKRWLTHPKRRGYEGLIFQPGSTACDPKFYNLWRGFSVEPKPGNCSLYWTHVEMNICGGDRTLFLYVKAWMANVVQTPGRRPGVAIVMRGKQGTGKGVFAKFFGRLFGAHFAHITNSHQLVGRFNALHKTAIVVFADESFWAGSKDAEGTLNAMITEETHNIEHKGVDPIPLRNFMHLIVASNHDWVVPASGEARRWLVLDVSEAQMQNHAYFKTIDEQMRNGGDAALLYELLHYDGGGVDLWAVPKTAALYDQKTQSMTPVEKFWFERLMAGVNLPGHDYYENGHLTGREGWYTFVQGSVLHGWYVIHARQSGLSRRATETEFGLQLKKLVPGLKNVRKTWDRLQWGKQGGGVDHVTTNGRDLLAHLYEFPKLEDCRAAFDEKMGHKHKWPSHSDLSDVEGEGRKGETSS